MSRVVSIRLPQSLYSQLSQHARGRDISVTEAARDLIRRGVGAVRSARDAGYEEGKLKAFHEDMKRRHGAKS